MTLPTWLIMKAKMKSPRSCATTRPPDSVCSSSTIILAASFATPNSKRRPSSMSTTSGARDVAKAADVRVYVKAVDEEGKTSPLYDDELSPLDRDQLAAMQASGVTFAPAIRQIDKLGSIEVVLKTTDGAVVGMEKKDAELIAGENGLPQPFRFQIPIENCQLWTPESPTLYLADVTIFDKSGEAIHGWTERFGVRELKVVGDKFYLNGKPYFLRGGGDHNYDQIHLTEPADHDRFREHMTTYKAAGFNYMRFHTHSPMPEYYGSPTKREFSFNRKSLLSRRYLRRVPVQSKRDMYELFRAPTQRVVRDLFLWQRRLSWRPIDKELYSWVKKYDPDRLVIHQDGGMGIKRRRRFHDQRNKQSVHYQSVEVGRARRY